MKIKIVSIKIPMVNQGESPDSKEKSYIEGIEIRFGFGDNESLVKDLTIVWRPYFDFKALFEQNSRYRLFAVFSHYQIPADTQYRLLAELEARIMKIVHNHA